MVADLDHDGDELDSDTEIRHRDRIETRLGWAARFRVLADRMEASLSPPPPEPPDVPAMRAPAESMH